MCIRDSRNTGSYNHRKQHKYVFRWYWIIARQISKGNICLRYIQWKKCLRSEAERWIEWSSHLLDNLCDCLICAPVKFQISSKRFDPMTCMMPVQSSHHLSYEDIQMWVGQFVELTCSRERNAEWKKFYEVWLRDEWSWFSSLLCTESL